LPTTLLGFDVLIFSRLT